jgi:hypothetical protein
MSLAVDTMKTRVHMVLADGARLDGFVFLSPISELGVGPETLYDAVTSNEPFMPFETEEGGISFVNQHQIIWVAEPAGPPPPEADPPSAQPRPVAVHFTGGEVLRCEAVIDLPEGRNRISDWLNQAKGFIPVQDGGRRMLVNLAFVVRVS